MRGYSAIGSNASGTATKTAVNVIAASTVRPSVFEVIAGSSGTPADQAAQLAVRRHTAVGTAGSSPAPFPFDPASVAALATAGAAHSAEPTYTSGAILLQIAMNLRATFRWVACPGFELVAPATANNGLGLQMISATAASVYDGQLSWFE